MDMPARACVFTRFSQVASVGGRERHEHVVTMWIMGGELSIVRRFRCFPVGANTQKSRGYMSASLGLSLLGSADNGTAAKTRQIH